ncbi:MAG: hypothetical protein PUB53_07560 [Bacteroidales bacterium]|nr:hypothetical protein [Bacteroidales bacterium]
MKADSLIFRKLSQADFKNISGQGGVEGGGGQGYIDISTKGVTREMMYSFLGTETSMGAKGPRWEFQVKSLSLDDEEQTIAIYQRRDASFCIASQKIGTRESNRVEIWKTERTGFPDESYDEISNPLIVYIVKATNNTYWAGWFYLNEGYHFKMNSATAAMFAKDDGYIKFEQDVEIDTKKYKWPFHFNFPSVIGMKEDNNNNDNMKFNHFLAALRTKPFMLLAGISGTGKSRIVREFAFKSCPKYLQDKAGTTPGNYCMIEVKPNWHDSTELLGYYSRLGKTGYQFTKFAKFLVKAKMFPTVPFFVCLDEMNLAPVEQYFAEMLSILETRKHPKNPETGEVNMNSVKTEPIIDAQYFRELSALPIAKNAQTGEPFSNKLTDRDIYLKLFDIDTESDIKEEVGNRTDLTTEGLTLPDNVVIIGTVNMDDTTHQFSRKVIDRAMTIEMNGGNLRKMFGGSKNLEYLPDEKQQKWQDAFTRRYVTADEVLEAHPDVAEELVEKLPAQLEEINKALKGTPFEVSYRVLNELTIMVGVMLDEGKELEDAIAQSVNNMLLMKILPRMEGDAEMFALSREYRNKVGVAHDNRLEWLKELAPDINVPSHDSTSDDGNAEEPAEKDKEHQQTAKEKIQEMIDRLNYQEFTRFWP